MQITAAGATVGVILLSIVLSKRMSTMWSSVRQLLCQRGGAVRGAIDNAARSSESDSEPSSRRRLGWGNADSTTRVVKLSAPTRTRRGGRCAQDHRRGGRCAQHHRQEGPRTRALRRPYDRQEFGQNQCLLGSKGVISIVFWIREQIWGPLIISSRMALFWFREDDAFQSSKH